MIGRHHQINGHEFEQALEESEERGWKSGLLQSIRSQRVEHN